MGRIPPVVSRGAGDPMAWAQLRHAILAAATILLHRPRAVIAHRGWISIAPCGLLGPEDLDIACAAATTIATENAFVSANVHGTPVFGAQLAGGALLVLGDPADPGVTPNEQALLASLAMRASTVLERVPQPSWRRGASNLVAPAQVQRAIGQLGRFAESPRPRPALTAYDALVFSAASPRVQGSQEWRVFGPGGPRGRPLWRTTMDANLHEFHSLALSAGLHEISTPLTSVRAHSELVLDLIAGGRSARWHSFLLTVHEDSLRLAERHEDLNLLVHTQWMGIAVHAARKW